VVTVGRDVQADNAMQRWPAAPEAAPAMAFKANSPLPSGIRIAWSDDSSQG
jgi:hypothetical protein